MSKSENWKNFETSKSRGMFKDIVVYLCDKIFYLYQNICFQRTFIITKKLLLYVK